MNICLFLPDSYEFKPKHESYISLFWKQPIAVVLYTKEQFYLKYDYIISCWIKVFLKKKILLIVNIWTAAYINRIE